MAGCSTVEELPPQHQVFINFRGSDLRMRFVSHLVTALKRNQINVFIDNYEDRGKPIEILLERIKESRIAVAIFSEKYTESEWCLRELAMIKDCMDKATLKVIPIFYNVDPATVRDLAKGDERKKKWKEAITAISLITGTILDKKSDQSLVIKKTVEDVRKLLKKFPSEGIQIASVKTTENSDSLNSSSPQKITTFGIDQRLKELEDKLDLTDKKTRIIGVVGMPGIGKSTLLKELFKKWDKKFQKRALIDLIRENSKSLEELEILPKLLVQKLLALNESDLDNVEDPYEKYKIQLLKSKVFVILDHVSKSEQINALLGELDWIKEGSRIVIATNDMSLLKDRVQDNPYVVKKLNHQDSLNLFSYNAFDQDNPPKDFMTLSEEFVHYANGHPFALKILGRELRGKKKEIWDSQLLNLAQSPHPYIGRVFHVSYDELTREQKEAFHDIACFRSQDKNYVKSLLDSPGAIEVLANKFLINICDDRVEMHDLLYIFSREFDPKERRLWRQEDIIKDGKINVLQNKMRAADVRGIFLDLSEVKNEKSLDRNHFNSMTNLRYLKFYNSHYPQEFKTDSKINLPYGLDLPFKEVRCLHWLKFPLDKLPNGFNPINLVDLKLPYSEIKQLWEGDKDTPVLKWVDLNHSSQLRNLSGLSKAKNLHALNLEGCTSLEYLGDVNLISLKTLTLSGCSNFKEFPLITENLEALYLDGTAISELPHNVNLVEHENCKWLKNRNVKYGNDQISYLPEAMNQLYQLTWLDLKYCKSLTSVPELPPNLRYFDAHGCSSLKTVAKPPVRILTTVQNHCTFNFTNCGSLEQDAKGGKHVVCSKEMSVAVICSVLVQRFCSALVFLDVRCLRGFVHEAVGSLLQRALPPHWHEKKLLG